MAQETRPADFITVGGKWGTGQVMPQGRGGKRLDRCGTPAAWRRASCGRGRPGVTGPAGSAPRVLWVHGALRAPPSLLFALPAGTHPPSPMKIARVASGARPALQPAFPGRVAESRGALQAPVSAEGSCSPAPRPLIPQSRGAFPHSSVFSRIPNGFRRLRSRGRGVGVFQASRPADGCPLGGAFKAGQPGSSRDAISGREHQPRSPGLGFRDVGCLLQCPAGPGTPRPRGPRSEQRRDEVTSGRSRYVWCRWSWASREGSGAPLMSSGQPALERGLGRAQPKGACGWVFFKAIAVLLADANPGPTGCLALSKGFVCVTFGSSEQSHTEATTVVPIL